MTRTAAAVHLQMKAPMKASCCATDVRAYRNVSDSLRILTRHDTMLAALEKAERLANKGVYGTQEYRQAVDRARQRQREREKALNKLQPPKSPLIQPIHQPARQPGAARVRTVLHHTVAKWQPCHGSCRIIR